MKKKDIIQMYRDFRKTHGNQKPNRVIVRMHWEDEPERDLVDTIGIVPNRLIGFTENIPGDTMILYYVSSIQELWKLTKPDNGSEFVVEEVLEFYKTKHPELDVVLLH